MSSQPYASFCIMGHLIEEVPEGIIPHKELNECPFCHQTLFHTVFNWRDREPETCLISVDPIGYEWVKVWNENVRGQIRVPIYDVSKIKKGWIDRSKGVENGL
jgi:hypothetical protein